MGFVGDASVGVRVTPIHAFQMRHNGLDFDFGFAHCGRVVGGWVVLWTLDKVIERGGIVVRLSGLSKCREEDGKELFQGCHCKENKEEGKRKVQCGLNSYQTERGDHGVGLGLCAFAMCGQKPLLWLE